MATRIDRLFCLLQDGQNPLVRETAAKQIGEICEMDPTKLETLIDRAYNLLFSDKWESRIAAGQVIEEILKHVKIVTNSHKTLLPFPLTVQGYNIKKVINNKDYLVQSNPSKTYLDLLLSHNCNNNELISLLILQRIGIISKEQISKLNTLKQSYLKQISEITENKCDKSENETMETVDCDLQKIETYLQKLKETQTETDSHNHDTNHNSKSKQLKDEDFKLLMTVRASLHPKNDMTHNSHRNRVVLIFNNLYNRLLPYLLHSHWKHRHGASIGLRAVLKYLKISHDNDSLFMEGCLICLSVLLLDRFFDFQSDILVAPISETVAQCLSLFLKNVSDGQFRDVLRLLMDTLEGMAQNNRWKIEYCVYLGMKYVLPIHYERIRCDTAVNDRIIHLCGEGIKHDSEDVKNMSAQCLLSIISVCNADMKESMKNKVFNAVLESLNGMSEYTCDNIGILNILCFIFNAKNGYNLSGVKESVYMKILDILLKFMSVKHASIAMKKQIIITLHTFIEFIVSNEMCVTNAQNIICLFESIFEEIMFERHKQTKDSIQILKDKNDFDECQMYAQYRVYLGYLKSIWDYLCDNLGHLIHLSDKLPKEYQQMILKLCNLLQKYCVFKQDTNDKKESENIEIPTSDLLHKIEQMKHGKKRKKNNESQMEMEPPSKKRKLNSNNVMHSKANKNENNALMYGKEIIFWSIVDEGCVLLSKLFCCNTLYALGWNTVQYLILQFIAQGNRQKNNTNAHSVYGWRRIIGCWLLSDSYALIAKHKLKIRSSNYSNKLTNVITKLNNITQNSIFNEYSELKLRRKMITHNTQNLIVTFKENETVYNEMNEYFKNIKFDKYVLALTNKYKEWNEKGSDNNERNKCYQTLLTAVLNAQYALDSHILLLKCSLSHIIIYNGTIASIDNIESVFQPILSGLSVQNKRLNLQFRCAESLAFAMQLLSENESNNNVLLKIFNNIVMDCKSNIECVPRDNTRMIIQCICDTFEDKIFDKLPFMMDKIQNVLTEYENNEWIPIAQIFACLISSIKCKNAKQKYLQPLIEQLIMNGMYKINKNETEMKSKENECENINFGICAQSRYCILQYLYTEPNTILPLIIHKSVPNLNSDDIFERLCCVQLLWDILYSIDHIKYETMNDTNTGHKCERYNDYSQLNLQKNKQTLLLQMIPYLSQLIVPLLQSMTDFNPVIRKKANQIFSISVRLIPLLPLKEDSILKQLINPSLISEFKCPFQYNGQLRDYQKDGINWLWFLQKFSFNGILADDMGLGKTLQTLLIITASYHTPQTNKSRLLPSLIVCPSTLLYHWLHEMNTFIPNLLVPFVVDGTKKKRQKLYSKLEQSVKDSNKNIAVIISYNTLKNDMDFLNKYTWNYCVLDEGHLIKNPKAKISICVKQIISKYRLILSGTPIQNNVLDLWSLFDFLMPGYLGTRAWFQKHFSSPITESYKSKAKNNSHKQRLGALKLETLHKQVLPFILRRLKCDVLKELPPKIIQDIEVNMSEVQSILYKHFLNCNKFKSDIQKMKNKNSKTNNSFPSLIYMRKLVVHPKLIMTREHPLHFEILQKLQSENLSLECIDISPKFVALKSLIEQCKLESNKSEHRMLIFVQYTLTIELIERLLLNVYFPDLQYLTLTSKVSKSEARMNVIQEFNREKSKYCLLLLTVSIGGLGLNLNTADIVVFMEHDWNPMKDLQAMDRAHRIGQSKTVHVFRIIVRNTIEWEIMNKQRFKQYIANTVISKENTSFANIGNASGSILDLFYTNNNHSALEEEKSSSGDGVDALGEVDKKTKKQKALDSMLDALGNMTAINEQYQNEYDLKTFLTDLK